MKKGLLIVTTIVTTIVISIVIIFVGILVLSNDRLKYEDYDYDIIYHNYQIFDNENFLNSYKFEFCQGKIYDYVVSVSAGVFDMFDFSKKEITLKNQYLVEWYPMVEEVIDGRVYYDCNLGDSYLKFIPKLADKNVGLIIIKLVNTEKTDKTTTYCAQMVKSIKFDDEENVTLEDIDKLYNKFIDEENKVLDKEYKISLKYSDDIEVLDLPTKAKVNEKVVFYIEYKEDIRWRYYLNNVGCDLVPAYGVTKFNNKEYIKCTFYMPSEDTLLSIREPEFMWEYENMHVKRYLDPKILSYDLQWELINSYRYSDKIPGYANNNHQIFNYYGTFNGAIIFDLDGDIRRKIDETIGDYQIKHLTFSMIVVYYKKEIYTLKEAYEKRIIDEEVLDVINNYYNDDVYLANK